MYRIVVSKAALKDFPNLTAAGLDKKVRALINLLKENPYQTPPTYEKLLFHISSPLRIQSNKNGNMHFSIVENSVENVEKPLKIIEW